MPTRPSPSINRPGSSSRKNDDVPAHQENRCLRRGGASPNSVSMLGLPVHQNLRLDSLAAVLLQTGFAPYLSTDSEHCNASFTSAFSPEFPSLQQHLYWGVGAPSASRTLRAMAFPRSGGTALPICFTICERFPLNTKSSSNDWSRAPSRGVSARSRSG